MKLTDKQREEIEQKYLKFCEEDPFNDQYVIHTNDIERLISSEQAWKEEAEQLSEENERLKDALENIQNELGRGYPGR
ncbi:hypothetical protein [Paenibacillus senegalensis]|uniref:hypothetical protein n=1 Tax=Paenibacillus senegalensis TaxID=1465766 RepID=UPI00028A16A2|nr:hypothetical protein [Paenibacillus senegalensis]